MQEYNLKTSPIVIQILKMLHITYPCYIFKMLISVLISFLKSQGKEKCKVLLFDYRSLLRIIVNVLCYWCTMELLV